MSVSSRTISDSARQRPLQDHYHKNETPPKSYDCFLPIGPFQMWIKHLMNAQGYGTRELSELLQLNERTIRRVLGTPVRRKGKVTGPQQTVSIDMVDWALTRADGQTQLWHLYPELYEFTDCDIEISA